MTMSPCHSLHQGPLPSTETCPPPPRDPFQHANYVSAHVRISLHYYKTFAKDCASETKRESHLKLCVNGEFNSIFLKQWMLIDFLRLQLLLLLAVQCFFYSYFLTAMYFLYSRSCFRQKGLPNTININIKKTLSSFSSPVLFTSDLKNK